MALNSNIPTSPITPTHNYNCDVSPTLTPEDNETYINYVERQLVECDDIPLSTTADFWNCTFCGSDEKYSQPVIAGDVIREQIGTNTNTYKTFKAYLYSLDTDKVLDDEAGITIASITDADGNSYLNITIDADNVAATCFYWKIYGFETEIDEGDLTTCIELNGLPGIPVKQTEIECCIAQSPEYQIFYSELYRKTESACEDTLLISGTYTKYDCDGQFYGEAETGTNTHQIVTRIPANIERSEYNFEETVVFNTRRTSKQSATYNLRTHKLPPYVVAKLAKIFNSQKVTIDGEDYKGGVKLSKNFSDGKMWIIDTTLRTDCDEIDFLC